MISVIIPVYNIEKYIEKCIQSVIAQSFEDLEIIIVDDGSTDSSGTICDEYARIDSRIKVIHKENEGLVKARKTGLLYSQGEYITYVDGDDWIDKDAYAYMNNCATEHDVDIVVCNHFESVGENDKVIYNRVPCGCHDKKSLVNNVYPAMLGGNDFYEWNFYTSLCDKMFRRENLLKTQLAVDDRITIGEDIACVIPAMFEAESVYISDRCFYHYRQTTSSMVKKVMNKSTEREKYSLLYEYVSNALLKYKCDTNINRHWIDLLLFIMVPRSDQLYDSFEYLDFIFPFTNIKKGSRIALYCAGTYGQRLYNYLVNSGDANVVVWVDQKYEEYQKLGLPVMNPEVLKEYEFDGVIIATMFSNSRKAIFSFINSLELNVPVGIIDEHYLRRKDVLKGFRLE